MGLILRQVKGLPLTFAEGDANLTYLEGLATNTGSFLSNAGGILTTGSAGSNQNVSGSLTVPSITGSLLGTASYATVALTAINATTSSYSLTSTSSSRAVTSSYALIAGTALFASDTNETLQSVSTRNFITTNKIVINLDASEATGEGLVVGNSIKIIGNANNSGDLNARIIMNGLKSDSIGNGCSIQLSTGSYFSAAIQLSNLGHFDVWNLRTTGSWVVNTRFNKNGDIENSGTIYAHETVLSTVSSSYNFVNDAAASGGGVPLGGLYHTAGTVKIRLA